MDKTIRQMIYEKAEDLKNTINQSDLTDTCRTLHRKIEYTFFSSAHGTFSRIGHMWGHELNLYIN